MTAKSPKHNNVKLLSDLSDLFATQHKTTCIDLDKWSASFFHNLSLKLKFFLTQSWIYDPTVRPLNVQQLMTVIQTVAKSYICLWKSPNHIQNTGLVPSNKSNESFFGCQLLDVCPGRFALELQLHKKESSTFVKSNKKHPQSSTRTMNELITEIRKQINSQCVRDERSYWVGNICDKSTLLMA